MTEGSNAQKPVLVICGPTASGKSHLALEMAQALDGVIINADSLQLFKGLDILTAQPSPADQEKIPHKLYGVLSPNDRCTAARYRDLALREIESAVKARKTPIVAGGTGFYLKALTQGLSPIPEVPAEIRAATIALHLKLKNAAFHKLLAEKDPAMAAKVSHTDTQRMLRAWEVLQATGKSLAEWQKLPLEGSPKHLSFRFLVIQPPRDELYAACDARFLKMIEQGALDEVRAFHEKLQSGAIAPASPLTKALGFSQLQLYLQGMMDLDEAIAEACQETRNYAKRQTTWLNHQVKAHLLLENADPKKAGGVNALLKKLDLA